MPLTFAETPLYYKDSQGQYHRILSGADMTGYRTAAAQDTIDANLMALGLTGASAGDLVRVNAVDANGKPTSWKHVPLCEIKTNPNLLDNWYFVYGKAINNDYSSNGNFPVNQRGNQAYQIGSGTMYTVDRWILAGSDSLTAYSTILGNEDGLSNANANAFYQIIENPQRFAGKTATFSALIKRTVASSASRIGFVVNDSWFGEYSQLPNTPGDETVVSCTVTFGSSITSIKPGIYDDTGTYQLKAVKLELGSKQTLAHQENGQWILDEIPDYNTELAKCQRYFQRISGQYNTFGVGFIQGPATSRASFKTTVYKPGATGTVYGTVYTSWAGHTGTNATPSTEVSEVIVSYGNVMIVLTGMSGLTTGQACMLQFRDSASYIDISAEL